jgi:fluoride ion exporter CrcB/FEX
MNPIILVMSGGAIGAALRYGLSRALPVGAAGWPWPTFAANAAAPDVLRTGFQHLGGALASKARIENKKVKVFFYAPLTYLLF